MKNSATVRSESLLPLDELKDVCASCNLRELCVPSGISADQLENLDSLVGSRRGLKRGETLFKDGDNFQSLFAVRRGFFKTTVSTEDGRDQIVGFQAPGELLGFDGMATEQHAVDAIALEDSEVCILPYSELERIARDFPPLQHQVHKVMSREIIRENKTMLLLGTMKADERVAAFLLNLSERYKNLGYSSNEFILRMTRQEIGSYLGLKLETVSRAFSKLQDQGIVEAKGKHVRLLDMIQLRKRVTCG